MTKTRAWSAGAALVGVLLIVASWFLLISPQRSEAASLRDQTAQQDASNQEIVLATARLKAQFTSLPERQAQLAEIKKQMPDNPALPALVRDLNKYAKAAGTTLVSVAPATPAPLAAAGPTGAAASASSIQSIQTAIVTTGSYAELTLYLQKLQSQMRRAVLVENVQLAKASGDDAEEGDLQMTLSGKVFVLDTAAAQAAVPATSPTATSTGNAN